MRPASRPTLTRKRFLRCRDRRQVLLLAAASMPLEGSKVIVVDERAAGGQAGASARLKTISISTEFLDRPRF